MRENIPMYILTLCLLAVSIYLHSPMTAIAIVGLWAVNAAQAVMARKNRDDDIVEMQATLAAHKAQMSALTRDVTNVAERARTILGENF